MRRERRATTLVATQTFSGCDRTTLAPRRGARRALRGRGFGHPRSPERRRERSGSGCLKERRPERSGRFAIRHRSGRSAGLQTRSARRAPERVARRRERRATVASGDSSAAPGRVAARCAGRGSGDPRSPGRRRERPARVVSKNAARSDQPLRDTTPIRPERGSPDPLGAPRAPERVAIRRERRATVASGRL
jgi:hypothetical protein